MATPQATCEYKKVKDCSIKADIFLPAARNPAVVLYFHGGALISGSRKYLSNYQAKRLTQAGLAVVSIDYRLAPETMLEAILTDIQDAIAWVKTTGADRFGWDSDRIAAMGGSAGGYLSLMTGTFAIKPKAIVSFYGYGDILGEWYTRPSEFYCQNEMISKEAAEASVGGREKSVGRNGRYTYYFYCRQQGIWPTAVSGYQLDIDQKKLLMFSPIHHITADYPPVLFLHGDQDTDVPYEQSVLMAAALESNGIENRLITVKGAGHGFDGDRKNPEVRLIFEDVVKFLQGHL